jgi:hypothetical protein
MLSKIQGWSNTLDLSFTDGEAAQILIPSNALIFNPLASSKDSILNNFQKTPVFTKRIWRASLQVLGSPNSFNSEMMQHCHA